MSAFQYNTLQGTNPGSGGKIIAVRIITHRLLSKPTKKHFAIFDDIKRYNLYNLKKLTADSSTSKLKMAEWFVVDFKNNLHVKTAVTALPGF